MSASVEQFQCDLLNWFDINQRELPWRRTYDPYQVWISEIMLQQTQMDRGVDYFKRWIKKYPDVYHLHSASEQELFKSWEGLGYYSRVRNIRKCAELLVREYGGRLPKTVDKLQKLPGIGPYTAGAISSIGYNQTVPVVDGNIGRIFARYFNIEEQLKLPKVKKQLWQQADELVPEGRAREFNQALMELGALICTPRKPNCEGCPIKEECFAYRFDAAHARPVKGDKVVIVPIYMATGVLLHDGKVFIQQRLDEDIWGGLWEFPGGSIERDETPEETVVREFEEETGFEVKLEKKITTAIHHYTRYKVTLHGYFCRLEQADQLPALTSAQDYRWVEPKELDLYGFPSGHRKLINYLQDKNLLS